MISMTVLLSSGIFNSQDATLTERNALGIILICAVCGAALWCIIHALLSGSFAILKKKEVNVGQKLSVQSHGYF
jgi:hypothetical protein